eukprot:2496311-Amphidinium_carterae.1
MDLGKMNKPDYFGREYYPVAGLQVRLKDNFEALLLWFVPIKITFLPATEQWSGRTPSGMSKMLVKRLFKSSELELFYWNYAVAYAADLLRHRALKLDYPNPAFGENVGIYTSQNKHK